MKSSFVLIAMIAFALAAAGPAYAGDAAAGEALSKKCAGCHGADGKGKKDNPAIAGMTEEHFIEEMGEYKSGEKVHKVMHSMSSKLSDDDIANLAAYYATLK